jgi:1,4-dihydroxy-2-naphthoate octaprenyltransferase
MATAAEWIEGARPRTLPAALAPVIAGTAVALFERDGTVNIVRALLALIVALALQVGVNYSNDYSDGIRGTDEKRVGPVRLVGQKLAEPAAVKRAALLSFAVAALAGLALTVLTGAWWLVLVGAAAIAAAWLYTGGPSPYGYAGLGEVFVFLFFGVVATMGSAFVQTGNLTWLAAIASFGIGALSCAILVTNNLRDIPGDTVSGKNTLAVRLGDQATRRFYCALLAAALIVVVLVAAMSTWWALLALLVAVPMAAPVKLVLSGAEGRSLIPVLAGTGRVLLMYAILLAAGLAIGTYT